MRYIKIKEMDVANGPGVRVSLWTAGCSHHCKGCFNPETWDFNAGQEFTKKEIEHIKQLLSDDKLVKREFSILGGDPLEPVNHEMLEKLLIELRKDFPNLDIWLWTGYLWENVKYIKFIKYVDYVVDGMFIEEQKNLRLKFKGSSNQRIIDVKQSLKTNKSIVADI